MTPMNKCRRPSRRKQLTDEQKSLLRRWIADGAVYQRHWAYEPPIRPEVAASGHPIDCLVAKQLSQLGLDPSPETDRRTLIRRLSFDLLGLPPEPDEVDAFVSSSAPNAYDQLVERLLSSPHFGERMAEGWLDVVRYADTIGYHSDNPRSVWPYRDYVIRAFNQNKRFDQFEIEQLAGDLLPDNTEEQRVASCFNRLLLTTQEGGAQPKDYEARMLADRVRAIGTVWLGQTFACCQCHDHKFDPISTRDFYSLGAFFADIDDKPDDPGTALPSADQAPELERLRSEAAALRRQYDVALPPKLVAAELAWESVVVAELADANRWQALIPADVSATLGTKLSSDDAGLVNVDAKAAKEVDTFVLKVATLLKDVTGLRLDVLPNSDLPQEGPGLATDGRFTLSEFEVTDTQGQRIPVAHASATNEASGFAAAYAIDGNVDDGRGWSTDVPGAPQAICVELADPISIGAATPLVIRLCQTKGNRHLAGRFRISATTAPKPVRAPQVITPPPEIVELIRVPAIDRKPDQLTQLVNYFKLQLPELVDLRSRTAAAEHKLADFECGVPHCLESDVVGQASHGARIAARQLDGRIGPNR